MKILCVSDYVDPLIYSNNVRTVFPDVDLILCAGDLPMDYVDFIVSMFNKPTYFVFGNHNLEEFRYYHKVSSNAPIKYNPNEKRDKQDASHGHGATYLGFKSIADKRFIVKNPKNGKPSPLLMVGTSGSIKYNNGLAQYTNLKMMMKLIALVPSMIKNKIMYGRYCDIFMTHASPRHIHDHEDPCHKGFECFNWFLKKFEPPYMIHGHIHLYDMREERVGKYFNSTVVNAYAHYVLDLPDIQVKGE